LLRSANQFALYLSPPSHKQQGPTFYKSGFVDLNPLSLIALRRHHTYIVNDGSADGDHSHGRQRTRSRL